MFSQLFFDHINNEFKKKWLAHISVLLLGKPLVLGGFKCLLGFLGVCLWQIKSLRIIIEVKVNFSFQMMIYLSVSWENSICYWAMNVNFTNVTLQGREMGRTVKSAEALCTTGLEGPGKSDASSQHIKPEWKWEAP